MVLLVYLFAGLPIQIGVMTQLGVPAPEASSWFFITWMTTGLFSLALSLFTRQPVSVNLSIPALVFLAGVAGGFSLPEILGANLVVGVVAIVLSMLRLNEVFSRLVPPQIAIGVFAGGMLAFIGKTAHLASADLAVSAPALGGFVVVYTIWRNHLLAVAVAAAAGLTGALAGGAQPVANGFTPSRLGAGLRTGP
jgi:benzoate membrane transport protein